MSDQNLDKLLNYSNPVSVMFWYEKHGFSTAMAYRKENKEV